MKNSQKESMTLHIEQWSSSGLSKAAYCKNAGISYHTFNYHVRGKEKKTEESGFALIETKATMTSRIELHLPSGSYFSLPENCSLNVLEKLVRIC
jgi:hypothetical protein